MRRIGKQPESAVHFMAFRSQSRIWPTQPRFERLGVQRDFVIEFRTGILLQSDG
jgi:hypothetical protein